MAQEGEVFEDARSGDLVKVEQTLDPSDRGCPEAATVELVYVEADERVAVSLAAFGENFKKVANPPEGL